MMQNSDVCEHEFSVLYKQPRAAYENILIMSCSKCGETKEVPAREFLQAEADKNIAYLLDFETESELESGQ